MVQQENSSEFSADGSNRQEENNCVVQQQTNTQDPTLPTNSSAPTTAGNLSPTLPPHSSAPTAAGSLSPTLSPHSSVPSVAGSLSDHTNYSMEQHTLPPISSAPTAVGNLSHTLPPHSSAPTAAGSLSQHTNSNMEQPTLPSLSSAPTAAGSLSQPTNHNMDQPTLPPLSSAPTAAGSLSQPTNHNMDQPTLPPLSSAPTAAGSLSQPTNHNMDQPTLPPLSSAPTAAGSLSQPTNHNMDQPTLPPLSSAPTAAGSLSQPTNHNMDQPTLPPLSSAPTAAGSLIHHTNYNMEQPTIPLLSSAPTAAGSLSQPTTYSMEQPPLRPHSSAPSLYQPWMPTDIFSFDLTLNQTNSQETPSRSLQSSAFSVPQHSPRPFTAERTEDNNSTGVPKSLLKLRLQNLPDIEDDNALNTPDARSGTAFDFDRDASFAEIMSSPNIADRKVSSSWDRKLDAVNKKLAALQRQVQDQNDKLNYIIQMLVGHKQQQQPSSMQSARQPVDFASSSQATRSSTLSAYEELDDVDVPTSLQTPVGWSDLVTSQLSTSVRPSLQPVSSLTQQLPFTQTPLSAYECDNFSDIPLPYRLTVDELTKIKANSQQRISNFAQNLTRRLFPELFGPDCLRRKFNYRGDAGKSELDQQRKTYMQRYILYFHPEINDVKSWQKRVITPVNELLRRPVGTRSNENTEV